MEIAVALAPSTVSKKPPLLMFPVNVKPPAPDEVTVAAAVKVTGIDKLAGEAEPFSRAPELVTPVPAISTRCHVDSDCALISKAPPEATRIILDDEPVQVALGLYLCPF